MLACLVEWVRAIFHDSILVENENEYRRKAYGKGGNEREISDIDDKWKHGDIPW
jgi:hypothetical protein